MRQTMILVVVTVCQNGHENIIGNQLRVSTKSKV